ncbi:hypothetical protein [Paenibacillus caseinilyticus]|uniref:hypothetical protein n=1 Tax=Paenibacillus caseinilyticus TaxID=3098138 RepID=UPI0022B8AE52|nr:hypothetical protein [Paenibacillus caseinilyticus]
MGYPPFFFLPKDYNTAAKGESPGEFPPASSDGRWGSAFWVFVQTILDQTGSESQHKNTADSGRFGGVFDSFMYGNR